MQKIIRFGVSLEAELLARFDSLIEKIGYPSRSEAIRDMIRERLVTEEWKQKEAVTIGILGLVYNHKARELAETLNKIQHEHFTLILSSTHVHLDEDNCLEVIILRGKSGLIQKVANILLSTKNVKHGKLLMTTTGEHID
jgi:CopG family nickel-responsive transcriptional regulator